MRLSNPLFLYRHKKDYKRDLQFFLFIMVCFGSVEMDHVISEIIRDNFTRNYRKTTIHGRFPITPLSNSMVKKIRSHNMTVLSKSVL